MARMPFTLPLAFRLARRELRGGLKGFKIFLACLLLGVAAIAGVGSLSQAMLQGVKDDGRALLGGEIDVRLIHRQASEAQLAWLRDNSARLSRTADLRAMARSRPGQDSGERTLVELKAVDDAYPLYGEVGIKPEQPLQEVLDNRGGRWGALVDPFLMTRLELAIGDPLKIGEAVFEVRGSIEREPDRAARAFTLGPRVLVSHDSLPATALVQPGSLIYHHYRVDLPEGADTKAWTRDLNAAFPEAGWRVRGLENAAPGITRFIDRVTLFMTLVGLTALLVGGVGVANAVTAYMDGKRATVATFKCLGAPARLVFLTYLAQILALALLGIALGLLLGAAIPLAAGPVLAGYLNFVIPVGVYPWPLTVAAVFGVLTALAFALWPLARAQGIPAAALFRDVVAHQTTRLPAWALSAIAATGGTLGALAVLNADDRLFALGFVGGTVGTLVAFRLAATGIVAIAKRVPRPRRPGLRLALANLYRPGAPTGSVVMSLGLGLTVLIAVALIEGNLSRQVGEEMPEEAPGFYFIDIQPQQLEAFTDLARNFEGVSEVHDVPMLRGRITGVNGTPVADLAIPDDVKWIFQGDRGITWARTPPDNGEIVRGSWWAPDDSGPTKVSISAELGEKMGLEIGDTITVNVLGRSVDAEIANWRRIDWSELRINFVMVFSPGLLSNAPQSYIATVHIAPDREAALQQAVNDQFPNISAIRVKDVLSRVSELLGNIATAVRATAAITVLAGTLVLAGAVAAGQRRRIYDAVVLKVLGATRRNVTMAFLLEYGLMGLATALIAAVIGSVAAWVVMTRVMDGDFVLLPWSIAVTAIAATAVTLVFGYAGTWRALRQKAAPLLRNE
ncbi:ABC transporter permease [Ferruginivarius sediminum]|uniref:ABC transporter permease n=1 Tax=Ferruginivarius sediminum TaxID=2661937 RepID=A0A369TKG3_9PROT|nr:FtsX-like permease family protein [Ferruginivarius sediminum]RDD63406.1 ABC transporter permease [Ferruginivarius sediminum]